MWEIVTDSQRETPIEVLARDGFHQQELVVAPIDPSQVRAHVLDLLHWRRLSGAWPPAEASLAVQTGFTKTNLAVPRTIFAQLVTELRELRDGLTSGTIAATLSNEPVPPPRPLTPELEEFERLWSIDREAARRLAEELYQRRG